MASDRRVVPSIQRSMWGRQCTRMPPEASTIIDLGKAPSLPEPMASKHYTDRSGVPSLDGMEMQARRSLPTPTLCGDWNRRGASPTSGDGLSAVGGPSIRLREWMMGLPRDWLAVEESELEKLRATLSSSRARKPSATPSRKRAR